MHSVRELSQHQIRVLYIYIQHLAKMHGFYNGATYAMRQWNIFALGVRDSDLGDDAVILIDGFGMDFKSELRLDVTKWISEYKEICDWYMESGASLTEIY